MVVGPTGADIQLRVEALGSLAGDLGWREGGMTMPVSHVTVRVPLTIRSRPGRRTMVSLEFDAEGGRIATKADPALMKALARAFRYQKLLDEGRYTSLSEMATPGDRSNRRILGVDPKLIYRRRTFPIRLGPGPVPTARAGQPPAS